MFSSVCFNIEEPGCKISVVFVASKTNDFQSSRQVCVDYAMECFSVMIPWMRHLQISPIYTDVIRKTSANITGCYKPPIEFKKVCEEAGNTGALWR